MKEQKYIFWGGKKEEALYVCRRQPEIDSFCLLFHLFFCGKFWLCVFMLNDVYVYIEIVVLKDGVLCT